MPDERWQRIEQELRREARGDPEAVAGVMRRVRAPARPGPLIRFWRWMVRPQRVMISPVGVFAGAAAVVLLVLLLSRSAEREPGVATVAGAAEGRGSYAAADARPVQFVLVAPEASEVMLVGDFNDWDPRATPLRRSAAEGIWTVVVPLRGGRYLYSFLVDGVRWIPDVSAPRGPDDEFGSARSVVFVGDQT